MSTDNYDLRVLEIDSGECRIRLRVVVIYYYVDDDGPTARGVVPVHRLPRDASFFLRMLWSESHWRGDDSPITNAIDMDQIHSELWTDDNCVRFVERVEQLQIRNDPPVEWLWPEMGHAAQRPPDATVCDYEELRTYADYDVGDRASVVGVSGVLAGMGYYGL